ncbi:hypothetical protein [Haloprofundus halophilus]|uniref:hypothetical protein n=1 Tax=Haloprofundus halophilus TaxID=2283527 RepID=UPI000E45262C|nr:hypothetical protein [Haloprofundus halophilus]
MGNGNSGALSESNARGGDAPARLGAGLSASAEQLRFVGVGVAAGLLVALAAYGFNRAQMVAAVPAWVPFVAGLLGGAYVHVLSRDLGESVRAFLVAFVFSTALYVVAALAPLWLLSYDPVARDLLIQSILREEVARLVFASLVPQLFVGYLSAVVVDGTFRP